MSDAGPAGAARPLLSEAARAVLERAVLDGTLRPGEQLVDAELIAWLGVSRTPIRTALEEMHDRGLVELSANRWTRVARPGRDEVEGDLEVWAGLLAPLLGRAVAGGRAAGGPSALAAVAGRLVGRATPVVERCQGRPVEIPELALLAAVPLHVARRSGGVLGAALGDVSARVALGLSGLACEVPLEAWSSYAPRVAPALASGEVDAALDAWRDLATAVLSTAVVPTADDGGAGSGVPEAR